MYETHNSELRASVSFSCLTLHCMMKMQKSTHVVEQYITFLKWSKNKGNIA